MKAERWLAVVGYEGLYEVSDMGAVRSLDRRVRCARGCGVRTIKGRMLKAALKPHGYCEVTLYRLDRTPRYHLVHALVLEAFTGTKPAGAEARHGDGNPVNNCVGNLTWGTRLDNMADQYRHGTRIASEWHPGAVLTVEQVQSIRESSELAPSLARALGVDPKTVYRARKGETYSVLSRREMSGATA